MASSCGEMLRDLELTRDEVERIGNALKDKEFRKLLCEYVEEIQDPENRKIYEAEITQLEKERGVDVTFINPVAGYVVKTSLDGSTKCFINICANENVQKPTSSPSCEDGVKGLKWSLPHILAPPRDDMDNKKMRCRVFDVCFHPNTLHLAQKNKAFRKMVNNTACEAIEKNFGIHLDKKNLKFPKLQYKGVPTASVIRRPTGEKPLERDPEEQKFYDKIYAQADQRYASSRPQNAGDKSPKKTKPSPGKDGEEDSAYTTPKYLIKHRSHVEMDEFTEHKTAKINSATPKELVVEVNLPLLKSAADITLDVTEKTVLLSSEKPAKYKLFLALPYKVNEDCGSAKFDKDAKKLVLTLPVKRIYESGVIFGDDSGVESDHNSPISSSPAEITLIGDGAVVLDSERTKTGEKFLEDDLRYTLPEYTCHRLENTLAFTLHVKNAEEGSVRTLCDPEKPAVHLKFSSISSGFYPAHYAFYARFKTSSPLNPAAVNVETWDNNVIIQITMEEPVDCYYVSLDGDEGALVEKFIEEPFIINNQLKECAFDDDDDDMDTPEKSIAVIDQETPINEDTKLLEKDGMQKEFSSKAIDIVPPSNGGSLTYSESSGDELSSSFSPSKSKGILKRLSKGRGFVSRSVSESSIDDYMFASSLENCCTSVDSVIPEDGEISSSLKKTVRFNDVVSRQLYRSNSSILGQKKKNQRKARNKKRALERRHSESEASEIEDKKEGDDKTTNDADDNDDKSKDKGIVRQASDEEGKDLQDIFDFDAI